MKQAKKLESLKETTFSQDFNKVLGGGGTGPKLPTGDLRFSLDKQGKVIDHSYAPEGPTGITMC